LPVQVRVTVIVLMRVSVLVQVRVAVFVLIIVRMVVIVMMVMMSFIVRRVFDRGAQTADEEAQANDENERAGDETEYRKESLRHDVLRGEERHESEREDADGVCDGDGQTEKDCVAGSPARADQVSADDGFAVTGRESVDSAERNGNEQP